MGFEIIIASKGLSKLPEKIKRFRALIIERVPMMLKQAGAEVARQSSDEYLSGPRPEKLGHVSGDLARSVGDANAKGGINKITENTIAIGTNLIYARPHEKGFNGTVRVPAHDRRVSMIFGHKITPILQHVSAFNRTMRLPARPFLAPALKDSKGTIKTIIQRIADKALAEVMA